MLKPIPQIWPWPPELKEAIESNRRRDDITEALKIISRAVRALQIEVQELKAALPPAMPHQEERLDDPASPTTDGASGQTVQQPAPILPPSELGHSVNS